MRTDLSKPIRTKHGDLPARYYGSPEPGQHVIAYRDAVGWYSSVFPEDRVDTYFENKPAEPRTAKVWVLWPKRGGAPWVHTKEPTWHDPDAVALTEHVIEEPRI